VKRENRELRAWGRRRVCEEGVLREVNVKRCRKDDVDEKGEEEVEEVNA
jgi:hypothetical protein